MADDNCESVLFNYETTNRTDYRDGEIKPLVKTLYRSRTKSRERGVAKLKDIHTLTDWKKENLPFDTLIKAKDIVRTNPRQVQKPYDKHPDLEREEIQRTRPRLVMTPAVSVDDITSNETRRILVEDMYLSTAHRMMQEGVSGIAGSIHAPFPGPPACANPMALRLLRPPVVSPEWRMDSVHWDGRQLRAKCDADKEFYLARTSKCNACRVTSYLKSQQKK